MPISEYFGGHGAEVMKSMKQQYGPEHGESVFYATANKDPEMKPGSDSSRCMDSGICGVDAIVAWGQPYGINVSEAGGPPASPELRKGIGI